MLPLERMRAMGRRLTLAVALLSLAACTFPSAPTTHPAPHSETAVSRGGDTASSVLWTPLPLGALAGLSEAVIQTADGALALPLAATTPRPAPTHGAKGFVRGVVLAPAAIVGQNGANIVGQNGANIVGQNGANVVGQNGANIVDQNGANYQFGQRVLAYATVRLTDAAGQAVLGPDGKPIETTTDGDGAYSLPVSSIPQNAVVEVTAPTLPGVLRAFVPAQSLPDAAPVVNVDLLSTLSIQYVLSQFVHADQSVLNRLTAAIEVEAQAGLALRVNEATITQLNGLGAEAIVATVQAAIAQDTTVRDVFNRIERLLVVFGVLKQGDGLPAREVSVSRVAGLYNLPDGLLLYSAQDHALRFVGADGRVKVVKASGDWGYAETAFSQFSGENPEHAGIATRGETIFVAIPHDHRVLAIDAQGKVTVVAGTGTPGMAALPAAAAGLPLNMPTGLVVLPDGRLLVAEGGNNRVLAIDATGKATLFAGGGDTVASATPAASGYRLHGVTGGVKLNQLRLHHPSGLAVDRAGQVLLCDRDDNALLRIDPDSGLAVRENGLFNLFRPIDVAVQGAVAFVAEMLPAGLVAHGLGTSEAATWARFDKAKYVSDEASLDSLPLFSALVCRDRDLALGYWGEAVYSVSLTNPAIGIVVGRSADVAENSFDGARKMAISGSGQVAVAEFGGEALRVVTPDGAVRVAAGSGLPGPVVLEADDATRVTLGSVSDVAWLPNGDLLVAVGGEKPCIRRITPAGKMTVAVGNGRSSYSDLPHGTATSFGLANPRSMAVSPDGTLWVADRDRGMLFTVSSAGEAAVVLPPGSLKSPDSLRWAPAGDLVCVETAGADITLISGTAKRVLATFADYGALLTPPGGSMRVAPTVTFDARGRLYVAADDRILRRDTPEGAFYVWGGRGGKVLSGRDTDTGLRDVTDLAFAPNGDLYVLESNQLKRLPAALMGE